MAYSITTVPSGKVHEALGISTERADHFIDAINTKLDELSEKKTDDPLRITDVAKLVIDELQIESINEIFYIGTKIGELIEQNSRPMGIRDLLESMLPDEDELASQLFRDTGKKPTDD